MSCLAQSSMSLANELLSQILSYLQSHDLTKVALSSVRLCDLAQAILFKELRIEATCVNVITALLNNRRLCAYVRSLRIILDHHHHHHCRSISEILSHMPLLRVLSLKISAVATSSAVLPNNHNIVYDNMHTVALSFAMDRHMVQFFNRTPNLRGLYLNEGTTPFMRYHIPTECLRHLQDFRGSLGMAMALVPGRPVHTLFLMSGSVNTHHLSNLAKSSAPIRILDIVIDETPPWPVLRRIAATMPQLIHLRAFLKDNRNWYLRRQDVSH